MNIRWSAALAASLSCALIAEAAPPSSGPTLEALLESAGQYAERYESDFKDVSAEESYTQKLFQSRGMRVQQIRVLKSDMVFVKFDGDLKWMGFRDVFESDGKPVRERKARLERIFQRAGAAAYGRAQQILDESARYNLGRTGRNFNLPTLAFVFLHPANQSRFRFKKKGQEKVQGVNAWEIEYEEKGRPAFIRDGSNNDLFSKGKLWVEEDGGRLVRSELKVQNAAGTYAVEMAVDFTPWREGGIWVPSQMQETCAYVPPAADRMPSLRGGSVMENLGNAATEQGEYVETVARYSNYRAFKIETTETFQAPPRPEPPSEPAP